ncbi:rRNA pseudouridine synthase [Pediococcus stilesii]|uniref:Pseudouridine synthase n=1 Tax=Pediococcus stilesii TaxID=331679 RepID=A0A5R9BVF1_9LACO|nr:pseudouridine synthase [Pediococcus stilesii]TLQ03892.1 rRNA pseudouridine synthase [Pediococcus stilesii]
MRIDKFLHDMNIGTRTQIRKLIKDKLVFINNELVKTGRMKVDPLADEVRLEEQVIEYKRYFYFMLNKPLGVVTATEDRKQKTVMDLFNKIDKRKDLFPVGRLDKDTQGLLLVTNNGILAHKLLSPEHHVSKAYEAVVTGKITEDIALEFQQGIVLKDGTQLKPAELLIGEYSALDNQTIVHITLNEGKYHQVRRMFGSVGERVVSLRRISFGPLDLDVGLLPGTYRELTDSEIDQLIN